MSKTELLHPSATAGVAGRMRAGQLAAFDPAGAFTIARAIAHPWYRCQAMASIAREAPGELATKAFRQARAAAADGADAYQRTAVLAYVIEAALARRATALAAEILREALARTPAVEPANSRAFALALIWARAFAGGDAMRAPIIACALVYCDPNRGWRTERLFHDIIARLPPERATALINALRTGRTKARLARRLARGPA